MFYRTILSKLAEWAEDSARKPLVLRGARQVGKTSVVHEFGKSFANYLYLNLEDKNAVRLFDSDRKVSDLLTYIFLYCNQTEQTGKTLLFIDEIQNSPAAMAKLRYFYEELPELYVIAAGSLLENVIDLHHSFPVGRVQYLAMRPCSFQEYLGAVGEERLCKVLKETGMTQVFHSALINHFNTYTLIGGMPEVVKRYAERRNIGLLSTIYDSLLQGYRDDAEKYAANELQMNILRFLLHAGWNKAGETITLGRFGGSEYKAKEIGESFRTLEKAMLMELVYPTSSTCVPAIGEMSRAPKLIWLDVGLVNYASEVQKEILGATDILDAWRGKMAEQVVAQELLTLSDKVSQKRCFWSRNSKESSAEVDFVWSHDSVLFPIEVKSGKNAHLRSLHSFIDRSAHDVAIRVWSQPLSVDEVRTQKGKSFKLVNLPLYLIGELPKVLNEL